jgi:hypothetical protein
MDSVTYVTALYNLRKREGMDGVNTDHFSRITDYIEVAKNLIDTPHPFVIFCEPDLEKPLREIRGERPTVFVVIDFEDLPFWHWRDAIARNNAKNPVVNVSPQKFTDLYYLIINHKVEFVRRTAESNVFKTEWFAWVDIRITLPSTGLTELAQWWDPDHVNIFMMNIIDHHTHTDFFRYNHGWVACGCFTGRREQILNFATTVTTEWRRALDDGYCPSDETMFAYTASKYPELVSPLGAGDYGDVMCNQAAVCRKQDVAYYIQEFALARGDLRTSIRIGESLRRGYLTNVLPRMADHEQFHIFYRLVLAYQRNNQPELAAERTKELFRPEFDSMRAQFTPHLRPCADA